MSEENVDQTNSTSTDRGADRSDRGEAQELSHGKRDRSREMLREELERNLDDATRRSGRPRDWEPEGRPAREAKSATDKAKDRDQSTSADGAAAPGAGAAAAIDTTSAPKSWRADEKHHYDRLPAEIKNAVHRREQEMQQGVDQLKSQYSDLDRALAPHMPVIKQFGHTPGQAVGRLFDWFSYLQKNPVEGFPAFVRSMGAEKVFQQHLQQQQSQPQAQQQGDPFQQYAASVEQRLNGFQQTIAQQEEARQEAHANAVIDEFKKGREHFETVRAQMATMIQSGLIPLRNGAVDLAAAYDASVKLHPELFEKTVAERIAAKEKRQREEAQRARRAGASLGMTSPGSNNTIGAKKRVGGKSVRASIEEALEEASGR